MHEEFTLRLAEEKDIENIFNLANDATVRKNSFHQEKISWATHINWFKSKLNSKDTFFYIIKTDKDFAGYIRLDRDNTKWLISIAISPDFRGKSYGLKALQKLKKIHPDKTLIAYVKIDNKASINMFLKDNFKIIQQELIFGQPAYKLIAAPQNRVYIIAEMSANHCGDKELAKKIIKKAKEIGADAVKIQTYTADTITIDCDKDIFMTKFDSLWAGQTLYNLYHKAYTPWEWQGELKAYADEIGIDFFSTPFDYTAVDFLESINVPMYKIASFEAIDYPLIKYAARHKKPMIISVGISSYDEIQGAIDACKSVGNNDITILKCTSAYPAKVEDMNLLTIKDMYEKFAPQGVKIGLSDHSMSIVPPVTAVALGATVIEKHLTLDRRLGGEDSGFSLNADEFAAMIKAVRETEKALGKVDYSINENNRKFARSLFVVKDIKKGEKFTPENIRSIRPSNGLHPKFYEEILGKTAACDLEFGTPLKEEFIKK